jgi:PAS domain S-box-containing protein
MIQSAKRFFDAPAFPDDMEQGRRARLLSLTINTAMLGVLLFLLATVLSDELPASTLVTAGLFLVLCLLLRPVLLRGHVDAAAVGITVLFYALVTFNAVALGLLRSAIGAGYILLVVLVTLFFGTRLASLSSVVVSSLTVATIALAEMNDLLPVTAVPTDRVDLVLHVILLGTAGVLAYFTLLTIRQSLERADRELAQRQRAEAALRASEEQLRAVADTMLEVVVLLDEQGRVQYANRAIRPVLGYELREVVGRPAAALAHPEDAPLLMSFLAEALAGDNGGANGRLPIEFRGRHAAGHDVDIEATAGQLSRDDRLGGIVAVLRDVSARRQTEVRLRQLVRAVEASPTSIIITDVHGVIEYTNPSFSRLTGYAPDEVLGRNPRLLSAGLTPPESYAGLWQTILAGDTWRGELVNRKKNGEVYWEWAVISPILDPESGRITHFVAIKEDISERKRNEEQLHLFNRELQQRNEELDAFAHTVAHDLRSPISLIVGFAELLRGDFGGELDEGGRQAIYHIVRNGRISAQIVESLLLLARVGSQHQVEVERLPMGLVVDGVLKRLAFHIEELAAEVTVRDAAGPAWRLAQGYWPWVEEVWVNLIMNGLQYGGRPPCISLSAHAGTDGFVRFGVTDNGRGLSAEQQERLFLPFERLGEFKVQGHGLGLSISRRIVERLGGRMGVESQPGRGCTFYFLLPAVPESTDNS